MNIEEISEPATSLMSEHDLIRHIAGTLNKVIAGLNEIDGRLLQLEHWMDSENTHRMEQRERG